MVGFNCESCGARVKAPPSLAGKTGKCPKCGTLNRVPPLARPAASEPEAGAESNRPAVSAMAQERDGSTPVGWADPVPAAQPVRPPQGRRYSPPRRSLASFVLAWCLILGAIILFCVSYAVLLHTASAIAKVEAQRLAELDVIFKARDEADKKASANENAEVAAIDATKEAEIKAIEAANEEADKKPSANENAEVAAIEATLDAETKAIQAHNGHSDEFAAAWERMSKARAAARERQSKANDAARERMSKARDAAWESWVKASQAEYERRDAAWKARSDACDSKCDAVNTRYSAKMAQIQKIGTYTTLALRVGAGLCALAGLIILSYWLATGGMRPSGVRLD